MSVKDPVKHLCGTFLTRFYNLQPVSSGDFLLSHHNHHHASCYLDGGVTIITQRFGLEVMAQQPLERRKDGADCCGEGFQSDAR